MKTRKGKNYPIGLDLAFEDGEGSSMEEHDRKREVGGQEERD